MIWVAISRNDKKIIVKNTDLLKLNKVLNKRVKSQYRNSENIALFLLPDKLRC